MSYLVVLSFARHGRSGPESFPRKREATPQTFGNALSKGWIPAFAEMTGISRDDIPNDITANYFDNVSIAAICLFRKKPGKPEDFWQVDCQREVRNS
jgi:hypothetical protein